MYAVIQDHGVVDYFQYEEDAYNEAFNCADHGDTEGLHVVKLIWDYNSNNKG